MHRVLCDLLALAAIGIVTFSIASAMGQAACRIDHLDTGGFRFVPLHGCQKAPL